jgi:hypothetical protein
MLTHEPPQTPGQFPGCGAMAGNIRHGESRNAASTTHRDIMEIAAIGIPCVGR